MGIDVALGSEGWLTRDDDPEPLVSGEGGLDFGALLGFPGVRRVRSDFRVMQWVDPYGLTVLNRIQMDDFLADLSLVERALNIDERRSERQRGLLRRTVDRVRGLAERCRTEPHTFLIFFGD